MTNDIKATPGSALASLRERRAAATKTLHIDLRVFPKERNIPGPPVFARFEPLTADALTKARKSVAKHTGDDREVVLNAVLLAGACRGVFEIIDGREVSVDPDDRDGEWPPFDDRLAALLGVDLKRGADVVRALYLTDGDILATGDRLIEWSGFANDQLDRDDEGN